MMRISKYLPLSPAMGLGCLIAACAAVDARASNLYCTDDSALAGWYKLNGGGQDASGNNQHGSVLGATPGTDRFGATNAAYQFDGVDDRIVVNGFAFTNSGDFTVSFWEVSAAQQRMHALSFGSVDGANLDFNFNDAGGIWVYWNGGGTHAVRAGSVGEFANGAWHHVLLLRSGTNVRLYIDGVLRGNTAYAGAIGASALLTIGRGSLAAYPFPWLGKIDEVRIWNRAVSAAEITALGGDYRPSGAVWVSVTTQAAFPQLDGAGALVFGGKMWLLGGWAPGSRPAPYTMNDVWSSPDGRTWASLGKAPWEPRHTAGYVVHDGRMWVVGGDANSGHYQNDVWHSSDGTNWVVASTNVPWGNRVLHHTVAFAGKIWVIGGQKLPQFIKQGPTNELFYNDVWNTTDGTNWTRVLEHAPWTPRGMIGGSVVFKNRMWLVGGGTYDTPQQPSRNYYNEVWSTADGLNWTNVLLDAPWEPRQYHDVAVFDNRMWVLEGFHDRNLNDVWSSADGVAWSQLENTPWPARHASSVFVYSNALWMVAGNLWNDVWKLPITNSPSLGMATPLSIEWEPAGTSSNAPPVVRLRFEGEPFRRYWLQRSTNLVDWSFSHTNCSNTSERTIELDVSGPTRFSFFRVTGAGYEDL